MIAQTITIIACFLVVIATTILFYEVHRYVWGWLPHIDIVSRKRVILVILAMFIGHIVSVSLYALFYWFLYITSTVGTFYGAFDGSFISIVYFSLASYSSLGYGDIYPGGAFRIIAGIEAINGLVLIGWSVSFTYLAMQKFWDVHYKNKKTINNCKKIKSLYKN